jgi:uncharacterized membrane protein (DUF373 family)
VKDQSELNTSRILRWSFVGKRAVAAVLMGMMFLVVGLVTVEILYLAVSVLLSGALPAVDQLFISEKDLLRVLSLFLSVLIALELIETVEVYFRKNAIHVEIVVLVAIIALARKVIILDLSAYGPMVLFALGFLVLALGVTYFLVRKASPADE